MKAININSKNISSKINKTQLQWAIKFLKNNKKKLFRKQKKC